MNDVKKLLLRLKHAESVITTQLQIIADANHLLHEQLYEVANTLLRDKEALINFASLNNEVVLDSYQKSVSFKNSVIEYKSNNTVAIIRDFDEEYGRGMEIITIPISFCYRTDWKDAYMEFFKK